MATKIHRRGAEGAEGARRLERHSTPLRILCVLRASAVSLNSHTLKKDIDLEPGAMSLACGGALK
jgi:hypothetical protein